MELLKNPGSILGFRNISYDRLRRTACLLQGISTLLRQSTTVGLPPPDRGERIEALAPSPGNDQGKKGGQKIQAEELNHTMIIMVLGERMEE
jgi:hypothetical protein